MVREKQPDLMDWVAIKKSGKVGRIVHVFTISEFEGCVVVLVGGERIICAYDDIDVQLRKIRR